MTYITIFAPFMAFFSFEVFKKFVLQKCHVILFFFSLCLIRRHNAALNLSSLIRVHDTLTKLSTIILLFAQGSEVNFDRDACDI